MLTTVASKIAELIQHPRCHISPSVDSTFINNAYDCIEEAQQQNHNELCGWIYAVLMTESLISSCRCNSKGCTNDEENRIFFIQASLILNKKNLEVGRIKERAFDIAVELMIEKNISNGITYDEVAREIEKLY